MNHRRKIKQTLNQSPDLLGSLASGTSHDAHVCPFPHSRLLAWHVPHSPHGYLPPWLAFPGAGPLLHAFSLASGPPKSHALQVFILVTDIAAAAIPTCL